VICGKPLHVWHLSLLKEHNILKLLGYTTEEDIYPEFFNQEFGKNDSENYSIALKKLETMLHIHMLLFNIKHKGVCNTCRWPWLQ
jgi:hypothetical protein